MGRKSFGEIVRQSVGIAAFVGIAIVLAGNITGNPEWYQGSYSTGKWPRYLSHDYLDRETDNLERLSYDNLKQRYERAISRELEKKTGK